MEMEINKGIVCSSSTPNKIGEGTELRRGPWTIEEDIILINYIENHGEGQWNSLARSSGLKRTGKSCRLRWLNYLRPDIRRGNITLEEQLLILELHSRFGNRWSKIAQHLPGRTDNEIKNYWRTRVQKHAKQLKCDVNSKQFKDVVHHLWIPRLLERIQANSTVPEPVNGQHEQSPGRSSSDSVVTRFSSPPTSDCFPVEGYNVVGGGSSVGDQTQEAEFGSLGGYSDRGLLDFEEWYMAMGDNLWNVEDIWF